MRLSGGIFIELLGENSNLMDSKSVDMSTMPLRAGHLHVWFAASLGQVAGAALATLTGIILPLVGIVRTSSLSSLAQGAIASSSLAGIMIGSLLFGRLSDRRGYLLYFRLCPAMILAASLAVVFVDSIAYLPAAMLVMGLGIGGEYSLDSDYISQILPRRWRLTAVGAAKALSSIGNIAVAAICYFVLRDGSDPHIWNRLMIIISALAALMLLCRLRFTQSPIWLAAHGFQPQAQQAARRLLGDGVTVATPEAAAAGHTPWREMFRGGNLRKVIFSGVPWACEGIGVYGIGVFLPALIMALGLESAAADPYRHVVESVELTTLVNFVILPGFILGLCFIGRWRPVRMQTWGFVLCAAGLALLLTSYRLHWPLWCSIGGFMIFELFLNAGPHLITFIIPTRIYDISERGSGAGIAAAFGKAGAVIGVFFMPQLLKWGGIELALGVTIAVHLVGAVVTAVMGRRIMPPKRG